MNKKRYFTWVPAISALFIGLFISCSDDYFNTETGGRITPEEHYKSLIDAEISTSGCFILLQDVAENMVLLDGLLSDQMDVTANADADMIALDRHESTVDNPYLDITNFYKIILNVNEVLPHLEQIIKLDRDFDSSAYEGYRGSLITLRSWAYFTMAKLYGKVAWVDTNQTNFDPSKPAVYLSKGEIINRLIEELLPFYDLEDINRFPIDHYALLGELYLEKNDYASAAQFLKFSIDGPAWAETETKNFYMVTTKYQKDDWQTIFVNAEEQTSTVRTAVPYSIENGRPNRLEDWMVFNYMVKPTNTIVNAFNNEVPASGSGGDVYRGKGISFNTNSDGAYINKYSIDLGLRSSADVTLYRDADIHLLLAEALNRLGQSNTALLLLNKGIKSASSKPDGYSKWTANIGIRGRVNLANQTIPTDVTNTVEYVEDLIIQERNEELAFEGKRWFDLIRIANRRGNPAYLADKVAAKFSNQATADQIRTKLMNPDNWYLPLP